VGRGRGGAIGPSPDFENSDFLVFLPTSLYFSYSPPPLEKTEMKSLI